jgi:hypothetical protein
MTPTELADDLDRQAADAKADVLIEQERVANLESIHLAWDYARAHGGTSGAEALRGFERRIAVLLAEARKRGELAGIERMIDALTHRDRCRFKNEGR